MSTLFVEAEQEEPVRVWVLEAGMGIFEGLEKVSVVRGWSKIFFNDAPFPPPILLDLSPLTFVLVMGSSAGFVAGTEEVTPFETLFPFSFAARRDVLFCCVTPVPVTRLVRLGPGSEGEGLYFANELAVGARSDEEERFTPVLPVLRPVPMLLLPLALLARLLADPSVFGTPRGPDSRFL